MMLFTNRRLLSAAAAFLVLTLIAGCSNTGKRRPQRQQPAEQTAGQQQPQPVIREFDPALVPMPAENFGPNPYLRRAPQVPSEAAQAFSEAMAKAQAGELEQAASELQALVDNYTTLSGPAYNLAVLKLQQEDVDAAKQYLETALSRNYYNLDARNLKAFLTREDGDFAGAEQEYKDIIKTWGGYAPAYRNLGILYDLYMGRIDDAVIYYKQYQALIPEEDHQVKGWIVDIERQQQARRAQQEREQAALTEQQAQEEGDTAAAPTEAANTTEATE